MKDQGLLVGSRTVKHVADNLISESNLVKVLEKYGRVEFTGSYAVDLMLNKDIDVYVICSDESVKTNSIAALNDLIKQGFFNGYLLYDWVNFSKPQFPKGYYVGLKTPYKDSKWKVDIWFVDELPKVNKEVMQKLSNIPDDLKSLILKIKQYKNEHNIESIDSFTIYQKVLDGSIKNQDDFIKLV